MACVLRISIFAQKKHFIEEFNNIRRTLTYVTHNSCTQQSLHPLYNNARCLSTKHNQETPEENTEIYYGSLSRQIRSLKLFSLFTSTGGLVAQPFLYSKAMESGNTVAILGIFGCISLLAVSTPLLIHMITKKYVTHLYYNENEDKYIANTYTLFARKRKLEFTPDDVVVPDVTGMFTNCIVKGNPLFLEQKFFYDSSHFIKIMGYDKPMDFKLGNSNDLDESDMVKKCKGSVNKK